MLNLRSSEGLFLLPLRTSNHGQIFPFEKIKRRKKFGGGNNLPCFLIEGIISVRENGPKVEQSENPRVTFC